VTEHDDIHLSAQEAHEADNPTVGAGTPETAPLEDVAVGWLRRQPVIAFALLLLVPAAGAAVEALASGQPVRAALIAAGGAVVARAAAFVRQLVTPVADPKIDKDTPLTV
jgi:hypothetical protein